MLFKEKLKSLRTSKGLTQTQLSEISGVTQQGISRLETGENEPSVFSAILLADAFNISLDELCCRDFKGEK